MELCKNPSAIFIDVRTAEEVAQPPQFPGAFLNVPVSVADASSPLKEAAARGELPEDRGAPIVVFCAAGGRAGKAREALLSQGYTNVVNGGSIGDVLAALPEEES